MNTNTELITWLAFPIISGGIGWITNYIAIKMLFHPQQPVNLGLFKLQGVFPKRKNMFAEKIGKLVAHKLLDMKSLRDKIDTPETREEIRSAILYEFEEIIIKFKASNPMIGMFLNEGIVTQIREKIGSYLDESMPNIIAKITNKLDNIDIQDVVTQKVKQFSNDELEQVLMNVISKELKFIEIAGGVLGFLIGILQVLLLVMIK